MGVDKFYRRSQVPGTIQSRTVTLTSAQILALKTTPVSLIPAPGAGKYISIDEVVAKAPAAGATAYTGANAVEIRYTDGSGQKLTGDLAAAWLNSVTSRVDKAVGAATATAVANAAVVAAVPVADPGAGTGTVTFDILYRVVTL